MTSYLNYLFSLSDSKNTINTISTDTQPTQSSCTCTTEYIPDVDKYYDSISLTIKDINTTLTIQMDIRKGEVGLYDAGLSNALDFLTYYCDKLQCNESMTIECEGDSICFFRSPFTISQEKDNDYITLTSISYIRCGTKFSTKLKKEDLLVEFRKCIEYLRNKTFL
jgi:hypothetical protein